MAQQIVVVDEGKMLEKIQSLPSQYERAWTNLWIKNIDIDPAKIENVIIAGMGGSGIAGIMVKGLTTDHTLVPIETWANYQLPKYADDKTLLIAVSCSGDTEEVLDVVKSDLEQKCQIVAISTGGKLKDLAKSHKFHLIDFDFDGPPRAAMGWLYGSLITLLAKLKYLPVREQAYFEAVSELKKTVEDQDFLAKAEELALSLNNKVPMILAPPPLDGVAKRWANSLNENAKTFAFYASMPELCHNVMVGLDFAIPEKLIVLYLETKFGFSRNTARETIIHKLFDDKHNTFIPLSVVSGSAMSEQWLLGYFGDLLSYYLAGVYGVDPTPIETVDALKDQLNKL